MSVLSRFKPIVYDVHENYPEEMLQKEWMPAGLRKLAACSVRVFQRVLTRGIGHVVIVAPSQEAEFANIAERIVQIRNYASIELLEMVKSNYLDRADVVAFTGSAYESNGSLLLLEVAAKVVAKAPQVKFHVVDRFQDERFRSRFMDLRGRHGLEHSVQLVPNVAPQEIMNTLNAATIAISPNLRVQKQEMAIPTKLFEYMAAALPIVCSDLSFARTIFSRDALGILARPEEPQTFANAVLELVRDRQRALAYGQNAQMAFRSQYSWESQMPILLRFYEQVLGRAR